MLSLSRPKERLKVRPDGNEWALALAEGRQQGYEEEGADRQTWQRRELQGARRRATLLAGGEGAVWSRVFALCFFARCERRIL